ncbi:MAG: endonuclease domain-containing protein [Alphaproteobacteria bacterium]|jgi:very-short-patch-repair endonuclease|nr:endonuclease domain-containing protein [Alphaproteobacteria bacterium]
MQLEKPNQTFKLRARELRKNSTLSEVLLWNQLKNKQFMELDFDRQKVINNKYIADLYCKQLNLIIEIDGNTHDNKYDYDIKRENYLLGLGLRVIHISDLDIKTNIEGVLTHIKNLI